MAIKKQSKVKKIRIHNPVTNSYYQVRKSSVPPRPKKDRILTKWSKLNK